MTSSNLEDAQKAPEPPTAEGLSDNTATEGPPDTGAHPKGALALAAPTHHASPASHGPQPDATKHRTDR